jgi:hypothetical protein
MKRMEEMKEMVRYGENHVIKKGSISISRMSFMVVLYNRTK